MQSINPRTRCAARVDELAALAKETPRPGDASAHAGRVLEAAGELLRRQSALNVNRQAVEAALRLPAQAAVEAYLSTVSLEELSARIARAADEAVESALPEGAEEAETWGAWALEGLAARDRLESLSSALQHLASSGADWAAPLHRSLVSSLSVLDRTLRGKARWFTGLNAARRAERDLLDEGGRAAAWWFSSRAECDGLIGWLGGEEIDGAHLRRCDDCRKDLDVAKTVEAPRTRHVNADELWKLDLGLLTRTERAAVDAHTGHCVECRRAVAALAEGERAIAEETQGPTPSQIPGVIPLRPADRGGSRGPEVLEEQKDFRVLLFRRNDRTRLVVQPSPSRRIAAAAVHLPEQHSRVGPPLRPRSTEEGLEFELPDRRSLEGTRITLKIDWDDGEEPYEDDLLL